MLDATARVELTKLEGRIDALERAKTDAARVDRLEKELAALKEWTRREFDALRRRTQA